MKRASLIVGLLVICLLSSGQPRVNRPESGAVRVVQAVRMPQIIVGNGCLLTAWPEQAQW
jgi:hypothetical protein